MGLFENCPKHYKSNTHLPPYIGGSSVVCLVMGYETEVNGLDSIYQYLMNLKYKLVSIKAGWLWR